MATVGDLTASELRAHLAGEGVGLDLGAARIRVRSNAPGYADCLHALYGAFELESTAGVFDVTAELRRGTGILQWFRPQVRFLVDRTEPFEAFPADTHVPLIEWGINHCVAERLNQHLLLHAASVERHGVGILLPGTPGSGKSTLAAALSTRGFRLLSDEFGVVRLTDARVLALLKPVALKNRSIEVIRAWAPDAIIGPEFPKTRKGRVAHLAPDIASVSRRRQSVVPRLVIFPKFNADRTLSLTPMSKAKAFAKIATNSFNYSMLGPAGFDAVAMMMQTVECHELAYGDLDRALDALVALTNKAGGSLPEDTREPVDERRERVAS